MQKVNEGDSKANSLTHIAHKVVIAQLKDKHVQMSAKKSIERFSEKVIVALFKGYKQLNDGATEGKPVILPTNPDLLTIDQKQQVMYAVNLIKLKRNGRVKGRVCADGSIQRNYLAEDENVASSTVSLEIVHVSLAIDAHEQRFIAITDIPGAYLHTGLPEDKEILIKFTSLFVGIMRDVNPEFSQHVRHEGKAKV